MAKHIYLLLILNLWVTVAFTQVSNLNISNGNVFDGEPFLGVNPTNTKQVTMAWIGYSLAQGVSIKVKSSLDGGTTWSQTLLMPHMNPGWHSADPSIAFDKGGNTYICYIDYRKSPDSGGIYVTKSADGGLNWQTPKKAFDLYDNGDRPIDRPWLVIDRSVNNGRFYIGTKPVSWDALPNRPYYKVSADAGNTWTPIRPVDSSDYTAGNITAPMPCPITGPNGKLYIMYPSWKNAVSKPNYILASSADGGASLSRSIMFTPDNTNATVDTVSKMAYNLKANPVDSLNLIFIYLSRKAGDLDVWTSRSDDGGKTWSVSFRVNDDNLQNNRDQDMIWGSFNEEGDYAVAWRDRRNSGGAGYEQDFDIYYSISKDKGKTFSANKKLNDQVIPYQSLLTADGNDFLGVGLAHDTVHAAWGDTRTGKLNIFYARDIAVAGNAGIEQALASEDVLYMFPNPGVQEAVVRFNSVRSEQVYLYTSNGLFVAQYTPQLIKDGQYECKIPIYTLAPGTYYVKAHNQTAALIRQ